MNNIKIKVKGYLKDIDEGIITNIDTFGRKNKNKITYNEETVTNTILQENNKLILIRENNDFKNILIFDLNKETISEYLLKENDLTIELNIKTNLVEIEDNYIKVRYLVIDSDNEYEYSIEMSEKYEYKNGNRAYHKM